MKYDEARERFIQAWGGLGSSWGVNRTMAQVHALLLISPDALSADEIMSILNISRGNANMNVRALIDWGLVSKEHKPGERREYFVADKDMWRVAMQVTRERRKRELEPVLRVLEEIKEVEGDGTDDEKHVNEFLSTIENLNQTVSQADRFLELILKSEKSLFASLLMKMLAKKDK